MYIFNGFNDTRYCSKLLFNSTCAGPIHRWKWSIDNLKYCKETGLFTYQLYCWRFEPREKEQKKTRIRSDPLEKPGPVLTLIKSGSGSDLIKNCDTFFSLSIFMYKIVLWKFYLSLHNYHFLWLHVTFGRDFGSGFEPSSDPSFFQLDPDPKLWELVCRNMIHL